MPALKREPMVEICSIGVSSDLFARTPVPRLRLEHRRRGDRGAMSGKSQLDGPPCGGGAKPSTRSINQAGRA